MRRSFLMALAFAACGGDKTDDTGGDTGTDTGTVPTETFSYRALALLGDGSTECALDCPAHELIMLCGVMTNNTATEQVVETPTTSLVDAWIISSSDGTETLTYNSAPTATEWPFDPHEEMMRCSAGWEGDVGSYSLDVEFGDGGTASMPFALQ